MPRDNTPNRTLFERALAERGLPRPDVVLETSDLAVLRGEPQVQLAFQLVPVFQRFAGHVGTQLQLSYELAAGALRLLPIALRETRRVIGITRRTDSVESPGARILMAEIARRWADVLSPVGSKASPAASRRAKR